MLFSVFMAPEKYGVVHGEMVRPTLVGMIMGGGGGVLSRLALEIDFSSHGFLGVGLCGFCFVSNWENNQGVRSVYLILMTRSVSRVSKRRLSNL